VTKNDLPRNVKLLGTASLLNDIASEVIYPLMPQFLIGVLGGIAALPSSLIFGWIYHAFGAFPAFAGAPDWRCAPRCCWQQ
jgi:hypothetical protein